MKKITYGYLFLGALIFIIDRITKMVALVCCTDSAHTVNQFLSFDLLFNRGVSWGLLHSTSDTVFVFVSLVIGIITAALCMW